MNAQSIILPVALCCFMSSAFAQAIPQAKADRALPQPEPQRFMVEVVGEGRPLILIPGLMSDARVWQPVQNELAEQFELHVVEIKGFGATASPQDASLVETGWLQALTGELSAYLLAHELEEVSVVGHSLGGFLAMAVALDNPDRIKQVVSIDGVPYLAPLFTRDPNTQVDDMRENAGQMLAYYRGLRSVEALAATVAQGVVIHATSEAHQQQIIDMSAASDPAVVAVAVHDLLQWDLRARLTEFDASLLLLGATGALPDHMQDQAAALYAQQIENLPSAQNGEILRIHRGSRHFIMFDDPEWLSAQILGFLQ